MKQNEKYIEPITPTLDGLKSENGFTIPENYFDSLHHSIMEKAKGEKTKTMFFTPRRILTYAASVAILISVSTFLFNSNKNIANELAFENTTSEAFFDEITETEFDIESSIEFDEIIAEF